MKIAIANATTFLLLLCLSAFETTIEQQSDAQQSGYRGNVKQVITKSAGFIFSRGRLHREKLKLDSIEQFSRRGQHLQYTAFSDDGRILYGDVHSYDPQGRLIRTKVKHSEFTYLSDIRTYKYDEVGNLIEELGTDLQGKLLHKSIYLYDKKGRKTEWTSFSYHPKQPSKPHRWKYSYDEKGRLKEEMAFEDNGNGFIPTDSLGKAHKTLFVYEDKNEPSLVSYFKTTGEPAGFLVLRYDPYGNSTEEIKYDKKEKVTSREKYQYTYDRYGNWTRQVTRSCFSENGKLNCQINEISYQIISYYK